MALFTAAAIAAILCAPGYTQSPAQKPASGQSGAAPPLRVMSRLVQISVLAQDKKGDPATGLTKDDFTLIDGGQPQKIAYFTEEATHVYSAAVPGAPTATPAAHLFSNRYDEKTGVPTSVTVILLDALNTHFTDMAYARDQVAKFLKQLQPQDRVALYGLSNKITVLHDFTSDASSLLRTLDGSATTESALLNGSESADFLTDSTDTSVNAWLDSMNQGVAEFYTINRVDQTAEALEAIANHLAGLPGRKNLIWVSGSFPINIGLDAPLDDMFNQRLSFDKEVEDAAEALNNANMAIYPVDARGLIAQPLLVDRAGTSGRTPKPRNASPNPAQQNFDTMNLLADRTGGRAFYNTNDLQGVIRGAIDDSRVTYVLGYYPSHNEWNGKFREIKVETKQPGVHLRFRRGYFAIPDSAIGPTQKAQMMDDAMHSTLESTDLGLDVQANPEDAPAGRRINMNVRVSSKGMSFAENGDHWTDDVQIVWIQLDKDGRILGNTANTLKLNLPQQSHDNVIRDGLVVSGDVPLMTGAAEVRLVARDGGSGAIGSVNIQLARLFAQTKPAAH